MAVQFIFMGLGSVLCLIFIVFLGLGRRYGTTTQGLNEKKYPLKELYIVGFMWQDTPIFRMRGKTAKRLNNDAKLIFGAKYAEYYARLAWAQMLTFAHLIMLSALLLVSFFKPNQTVLVVVMGAMFTMAVVSYYLDNMKEVLNKRRTGCVAALPDVVTTLALLVNSGMVIREAWGTVAESGQGQIYDLMQSTIEQMENGCSTTDAIYEFGVLSDAPEIRKFTSTMIQGVEKGSTELSYLLIQQSSEQWNHKKQVMLQRGEAASSKLLMPIGLMFVGLIIIVVIPIFGNLLSGL